ncbi:MAG: response regulator transcription factor [Chloroflexota bacterium]|nr:response regulator transcription factor [Chloroflexota bacterium]
MNRKTFNRRGPARVLVMMDQRVITEVITLTLNHGVYVTQGAKNISQAMALLEEWHPHLAVIDMDIAGDQFMKRASTTNPGTVERLPVLALTRRGDLKTKLNAFEQGVDDIMTVPFSPEELLARVMALTRRTYGDSVPLTPVIKVGELEINILDRQVTAGSSKLHLTGVEQSLLYLLAANAGRLLTRNDIMDALWGVDYVAESNVVDRHIRNLRAKLQNDWRKPRFIATEAGRGYRFMATFSEPEETT